MGFEVSEKVQALNTKLEAFMQEHVYPREKDWREFTLDQNSLWQTPPWFDELRELAKAEGLWNLFLPTAESLDDIEALLPGSIDPKHLAI